MLGSVGRLVTFDPFHSDGRISPPGNALVARSSPRHAKATTCCNPRHSNPATVFKNENRFDEAEALMRATLQTQERLLDRDDPDTSASRSLLADILLKEKRPQEAEESAGRAFKDQLRTLGPQHQDTLESLRIDGAARTQTGRYDDAREMYTDTIGKIGADRGQAAREGVVDLWYDLACLAVSTGRRDEAFDFLEHAVDAGYNNAPFLRTDVALKSLHSDPRFEKLLSGATAVSRQPPSK
jgi:tetratricopeptide (TPR) repeat protein